MLFLLLLKVCLTIDFAIEWPEGTNYDFLDIEKKAEVSYDFPFINKSDEPISVDIVRTSCGCAASSWSDDPVPVDSTGYIRVTYDASDSGYFKKRIKVFFKGVKTAEKLTIEGFIVE